MRFDASSRNGTGRRAFLRGAGAFCLALPFLQSLGKPARAESAAPIRFVPWIGWWGTLPQYWMGPGEGADFQWGDVTRPLDPLRQKTSIVSGINMASVFKQFGLAGNHDIGGPSVLTSAPRLTREDGLNGSTGPSIDSVVANRLPVTKHRSLFVGDGSDHSHSILVREGEQADWYPRPVIDPVELFDMLFAEFGGDTAERERLRASKKSILDATLPEYEALASKVSPADKALVDRHLTSLREIEISISAVAECAPPERPTGGWDGTARAIEAYKLLFDMTAIALACDLTRVAVISFSGYRTSARDVVPIFDALNPEKPDSDMHGFSHAHWREVGQTAVQKEILIWRTNMLRDFALKLDSIPEGDGTTVLDNTVIAHTSEILTGLHDGLPHQEWGYSNLMDDAPVRPTGLPIALIGGAGGALKTGQHFRLDKTHTYGDGLGKYSHGELWLTLARAVGIDEASLPTFGDPDVCKSLIEEILT
jgi:hypothetical protein